MKKQLKKFKYTFMPETTWILHDRIVSSNNSNNSMVSLIVYREDELKKRKASRVFRIVEETSGLSLGEYPMEHMEHSTDIIDTIYAQAYWKNMDVPELIQDAKKNHKIQDGTPFIIFF